VSGKDSDKEKSELLKSDSNSTGKLTLCVIIAASVVGAVLLAIVIYLIITLPNWVPLDTIFIPQPFAEKNTFTYFKLSNELQVLLAKPNQHLNSTYIGDVISFVSRRRI
jgi:hypothetical protein